MTDTERNAISDAVAETLEALAFMEVEAANKDAELSNTEPHYWSRLTLDYPIKGDMLLVMPESLIKQISKIVFDTPDVSNETDKNDIDDNHIDETILDITGETINTLAGNILKRLVPENETFQIGLPKIGCGIPEPLTNSPCIFISNDTIFEVDMMSRKNYT